VPRKTKEKTPSIYDHWEFYDAIFGDTEEEIRFLTAVFSRNIPDAQTLLEPACGSGRLILEFLEAGYRVCGFDLSKTAIQLARREAEALGGGDVSAFWQGELTRFAVPAKFAPVDGAYSLTCTLNELSSFGQLWWHFKAMAAALAPGGIYVADFYLGGHDDDWGSGSIASAGKVIPWEARIALAKSDPPWPERLHLIFRIGGTEFQPIVIHRHARQQLAFAYRDWFDVAGEYDGHSLKHATSRSPIVSLVLRRR
jgi:SAM-dependent methyltransferase